MALQWLSMAERQDPGRLEQYQSERSELDDR